MSDFETFLETLEHVPPDFERNLNLIQDLDSQSFALIGTVNDLIAKYKLSRKKRERVQLKKEIMTSMDKLINFADEKVSKGQQTYEMVDRSIEQLIELKKTEDSEVDSDRRHIGLNMPPKEHEPLYCICRNISHGEMVACDNEDCKYEWFHYSCINLKSAPKGKWYCDICSAQMKMNKMKKGRRRR